MADYQYIPVDHDSHEDPGVPNHLGTYMGNGVAWMGSQPPTMYKDAFKEVGQKAYEMTGIPDIQAGTQQLSEGNVLAGIGQTGAGVAQFGSLIAPPYLKAAREFGVGAARPIAGIVPSLLKDEAGTLLGRQATGADLDLLKVAEQSEGKYTNEDIRKATGWFRGPDNQWKWEQSDADSAINRLKFARIRQGGLGGGEDDLTNILNHPELYKNYPGLFDKYKVFSNPDLVGTTHYAGVDTQNKIIHLNPDLNAGDVRSALLHEAQHVIQEKEGFGIGGSPEQFHPPDMAQKMQTFKDAYSEFVNKVEDNYPPAIVKAVISGLQGSTLSPARLEAILGKDLAAEGLAVQKHGHEIYRIAAEGDQKYNDLAGEAEARLVQARRNLTPDDLKQFSPLTTKGLAHEYDVPPTDQIVQFSNQGVVPFKPKSFNFIPVDHTPEFK